MAIYLDNASTTPLAKEVLDEMMPYLRSEYGNPSSIHSRGRKTRNAIEQARKKVAHYLNASPSEIFFTSGGTETNNQALRCAVRDMGVRHIVTSEIEHHCILHSLEDAKRMGARTHFVRLGAKGHVELQHLDETLSGLEGLTLVSLMHANNEIGNLLDLSEAGAICKKHKAIFHSDTVQTVGHYKIDLQKIPVDMISGSAHKMHGPKGVGFAYFRNSVNIKPMLYGGSQERNMRAGTENVYGIVGLGKAMEIAYENLEEDSAYIQSLKTAMIRRIRQEFPDALFNGDAEGRSLYTVLNVAFPPGEKSGMLLFNLDVAGVCASSGSACNSGSDEESHVLAVIGADRRRPSIRFSFSKYNTADEIDAVMEKLKTLVPASVS